MHIVAVKPNHDGSIASIVDGRLAFLIENEKDSQPRRSVLGRAAQSRALKRLETPPDLFAEGGWHEYGAGYLGLDRRSLGTCRFAGKKVRHFSSSHESSHIFGVYGLSPHEQGRPCYVLNWEGTIGRFYRVGRSLDIQRLPSVLSYPGYRYVYLYYLASREEGRDSLMAGKLMALAEQRKPQPESPAETRLRKRLLTSQIPEYARPISRHFPPKSELGDIPWIHGGLETAQFKSFARRFSDDLFDIFYKFAKQHLKERLPLLITGGCGLNCDWNTKWRDSGLFADVFVPPCPNDSGSALGTGVEAQFVCTGNAKIEWSVYAGEEFAADCAIPDTWATSPLDLERVAAFLQHGQVVAWVQGRYEMGPRALGHRSILADPYAQAMTDRLNELKHREGFRPIAPVCLEEDAPKHFSWKGASPYMLYFQQVKDPKIRAVTHADGTARVQTVTPEENESLHRLLGAFKRATGAAVLCNTSLNFPGRGFINKMSDLLEFAEQTKIRVLVVDQRMLVQRAETPSRAAAGRRSRAKASRPRAA